MTPQEKIVEIEAVLGDMLPDVYYDLLEKLGDIKRNYWDYMTTEPINCNIELKRIDTANYELCTALLTMLLREDHFCNGMFWEHYKRGEVNAILNRMVIALDKEK